MKEVWELTCIKDMIEPRPTFHVFVKGTKYRVKDKFVGDDGTFETGHWEMKAEYGNMRSISAEVREEYFKAE